MADLRYYDIIDKPVITEKSMADMAVKKYTFLVHPEANKSMIKEAVEKMFEGTKVADNKIVVVDEFKLDEIKTKKFVEVMNNLKVNKALVVVEEDNKNVVLSGRNIPTVKVDANNEINTYDVVNYDT